MNHFVNKCKKRRNLIIAKELLRGPRARLLPKWFVLRDRPASQRVFVCVNLPHIRLPVILLRFRCWFSKFQSKFDHDSAGGSASRTALRKWPSRPTGWKGKEEALKSVRIKSILQQNKKKKDVQTENKKCVVEKMSKRARTCKLNCFTSGSGRGNSWKFCIYKINTAWKQEETKIYLK